MTPGLPLWVERHGDGAEQQGDGAEQYLSENEQIRVALISVARRELGVREATGRNDGPRVAEYLRYTGLAPGHEWCAAFVSWCYGQVGLVEPRTPWSPALFPARRVVWNRSDTRDRTADPAGNRTIDPRPGDVFGIWVREKGRIGHAGLIERWDATDHWCVTIEGNHQDAVRRVRRPIGSIYRVADWVSANGKGGEQ